jgi:hypothetical protein
MYGHGDRWGMAWQIGEPELLWDNSVLKADKSLIPASGMS